MTAFAILRFEKLKSRKAVSMSAGHMTRSRPTPNADPDRRPYNRILIGSDRPMKDVDKRLAGAVTRKNSVLAVEVLMSASPEWFENATREEKGQWMRRSQAWLVSHFGAENVVSLSLHMDETTPHLTGFIVPRDVTGRLNAARWMDGAKKLTDMQTAYAKRLESLGIERGIEGSEAVHQPPKKLRAEAADVDDATPAEVKELARRAVFAEKRADEYRETAIALEEAAKTARDVPLTEVAEALGMSRVPGDRGAWQDPEKAHKLTFDGGKWFDHRQGRGGGGAIDLVMHVAGRAFREAVAWLGFEVGPKATARAMTAKTAQGAAQEVASAMKEAAPFSPPLQAPQGPLAASATRWLRSRGISAALLLRQDSIYTDERGNAVFLAKDAMGLARSAELRGTGKTPFHGLAKGSSRSLPWSLDVAGESRRLVVTEGAVDALSYADLHPDEPARVISTAGVRPALPEAVRRSIEGGRWDEVVVAYDNDPVGHQAAARMMDDLTGLNVTVTRATPDLKDWNDDLKARRALEAIPLSRRIADVSLQAAAPAAENPGASRPVGP